MVSGVEAKRLEVEQTTSNKTETTFTISYTCRYQLTGYIATERDSSIEELNAHADMFCFTPTTVIDHRIKLDSITWHITEVR